MTNHPWVVSRRPLQEALGLDALELVNDFVAQAMAVRLLRDEDLLPIGPDLPPRRTAGSRTCGVLGPGTGLASAR